ncbi:hypothetical protein HYH03_015959 [Edaphochlamys debaryana]|uniref:Uncharacterized protein n=1 Tax=Edaphochlamys debaryana TaxID=47281 RepID=A0A835XSN5_9CHLO|nr:hypothetical protein HYH03_015959 [Edaphochlamys debaryana]|eukprot:KAG2485284.1 hypothetical protein HYH03_015959 [Edaphochlamys debaryana]
MTWRTALRMLNPKSDSQAALLSWANLEPVLRLADKYDSAVLRAMCVAFMTCNQADIKLEEPLTSATNTLIAATLLEQCCSEPELEMYTKSIHAVLDAALTAPTGQVQEKAFLGKLKVLLTSPLYMKLVSPSVQARVLTMVVSVMESVMSAPTGPCCTSAGCRRAKASIHTSTSVCTWYCACGTQNYS